MTKVTREWLASLPNAILFDDENPPEQNLVIYFRAPLEDEILQFDWTPSTLGDCDAEMSDCWIDDYKLATPKTRQGVISILRMCRIWTEDETKLYLKR